MDKNLFHDRRDGGNTTQASSSSSSQTTVLAVSITVAVVVVLLLLGVIIFYMRRRRRFDRRRLSDLGHQIEGTNLYGVQSDEKVQLRARSGAVRELVDSACSADRLTRIVSGEYDYPPGLENNVIEVGHFPDDLDTKEAINVLTDVVARFRDCNAALKAELDATERIAEYDKLDETCTTYASEHSVLEHNRLKNRYANVKAYDHSRVVLPIVNDDPDSDYINANFVQGANGPKEFIATQGPIPNSYISFWRMIWAQDVKVILMVTNEVEGGRVKCHRYWPDKDSANGATVTSFGQMLEVRHLYTSLHPEFTVRKFTLTKEGKEVREITHIMYTTWPDHGVPSSAAGFFRLRKFVNETAGDRSSPIVVHCSAGVGRTGTYIAIDTLVTKASRLELPLDVHECVRTMRHARNMMVQTVEQYLFVHAAVLEGINALMTGAMERFFQENCEQDKETEEDLYDKARPIVPSARPSFSEMLSVQTKPFLVVEDSDGDVGHSYLNRQCSVPIDGLPAGESGSLERGVSFDVDAGGGLVVKSIRRSNPLIPVKNTLSSPSRRSVQIRPIAEANATSNTDEKNISSSSQDLEKKSVPVCVPSCPTPMATRHARAEFLRQQWSRIEDSAEDHLLSMARTNSYEGALNDIQ